MKASLPRFGGEKYGDDQREESRTKSGALYKPQLRRNKRDVWAISTAGFKGAHFATFPAALVRPCILAGSRPGGIVLDPFIGSGTTAAVAIETDVNPEYVSIAKKRAEAAAVAAAKKGAQPHER